MMSEEDACHGCIPKQNRAQQTKTGDSSEQITDASPEVKMRSD